MKKCAICKESPVIRATGFCEKHHRRYIQHLRKVKRDFIFKEKKMIAIIKSIRKNK